MRGLNNTTRSRRGRWAGFAGGCLLLGLIWMVLLPWIGQQERVQRDLQQLDQLGVNAGALYYTDLRILPELLRRLDRIHREEPAVFWRPGVPPAPISSSSTAVPPRPVLFK